MTTVNDIVPSLSLDNFIAQRDAMVARVKTARAALQEIYDIAEALPNIPGSSGWFRLGLYTEPERQEFSDDRGFTNYVKAIDAACWARLLDLSGLRTFMDAEARKKWDENISKRNVPELTYDNVAATFRAMHASRRDMFERGVVAVFKGLSWDYKTNNPVMFGKRIIIRHIYSTWGKGWLTVNYDGANKLDDVARVLYLLDGKPEPDHRQAAYRRLNDAKDAGLVAADFDGYFTVKGYKNGNGHLTFLRPDLVDEMNRIIAKHYPGALPPGREEFPAASSPPARGATSTVMTGNAGVEDATS